MTSVASGNVVDMAEKAMQGMGMGSKHAEEVKKCVTCNAKDDPSGATMTAVTFEGTKNMTVIEHHKPAVTDEADAIIRMTSSGLCGTDLHIYLGHVPGMRNGRIIGHEVIGIVDSVGPKVTDIKKGDRVAVSTQISCGDCHFCKKEQFSECDNTNASVAQEKLLGGRTAGIPGFNELSGGFNGGQAEFVRVPFADVNLLKLPPESEISDAKVLPLTDILCTAWLGNELGKVKENDVVAIWGAGPVGQLASQCAFVRGARRVILVDKLAYRLEFAKKTMPKIETVDFSKGPSSSYAGENQVLEMCRNEPAHAPDVCIECVGMHYAHSFMHKVEMALGLETDTPEALNAAIHACKKGGRVVGIGVYVGLANHFNVGAILMKSLSLKMGTVPPQRYWHQLLEMIKEGKIDPSVIVTHTMALEDAPKAYQIFDEKLDDVIKIVFKPPTQPGNP